MSSKLYALDATPVILLARIAGATTASRQMAKSTIGTSTKTKRSCGGTPYSTADSIDAR
jgi:hypothetical protein